MVASTHDLEKPPEPGTCQHCGNSFKPRRFWQRFCRSACKAAHHAAVRRLALEAWRTAGKEKPRR